MKVVRIIFSCVCLLSAFAFSQTSPGNKMGMMPPFGGPGGMHGTPENASPMMMDITELKSLLVEINIDKTVSAKIVAIARTFKNTLEERIIKIQKEELSIKEELLKDKPDLQAIQGTISRKTQIFGEIEFAQIKRDLEIKSLLSQDEYDRWKSAMMEKMRRMAPRLMDKAPPTPGDKNEPRK
jgi:hypothetical protein